MAGLTGYDGSLYREWMQNHPDDHDGMPDDGNSVSRLSYHAYTQDTMVLTELYNVVVQFLTDGKGKRLLQPGEKTDEEKREERKLDLADASAASMLAFLSQLG